MSSIDRCRPKLSGAMVLPASAKQPPPTAVHERADGEGHHLDAGAVDARRDGPDLVVPHRDRGPPDAAADQVRGQEEHHDGDEEDGDEDPGVVVRGDRAPRTAPSSGSRSGTSPLPTVMVLPLPPPVRLSIFLTIEGKAERDPQRHQGQVEVADAQRRQADEHADGEPDGAGHRQGGEERPAVVGDEDHRRVGADPEEGRVAERHLAGVARDEVEPQDGDAQRHRLRPPQHQVVLPRPEDVRPRRRGRTASPAPARRGARPTPGR